ncbi:MAG: hypothetical protein ACJ76F_08125 [Bacteroidia bacterium]
MEKEKWIQEALDSTKGMQKAETSPFLMEKIMQGLEQQKQGRTTPAFQVPKWIMAACFILAVNLFSIAYLFIKDKNTKKEQALKAISSEMGYTQSYTY